MTFCRGRQFDHAKPPIRQSPLKLVYALCAGESARIDCFGLGPINNVAVEVVRTPELASTINGIGHDHPSIAR